MEQIIKEIEEYISSGMYQYEGIGLTKEQLETIVDTYKNYKNINDTLNEQVKYIKIVSELAEFLTKAITIDYQKERHLANEDMDKGAAIAYQDIYNHLSEIMNDEPREDNIS